MHRHARELAKVKAKVAGIGAMMAKISPGAGDVYDSTEDSHKQYVDKMGSRWKASPRSPAKVTIPPAVEQSLMRLLGGFRSYAEGLERAGHGPAVQNGDGRYANEYAQNNKDRLEASEVFLAANWAASSMPPTGRQPRSLLPSIGRTRTDRARAGLFWRQAGRQEG